MYLSEDKQQRFTPITNIAELHHQLQLAIELEFSTLPPYLSALYSIKENTNNCAYQVIQSVVMEEMFHLSNAANVLSATGGSPAINSQAFLPSFPTKLPDGEQWFEVSLLKFSPEAVQTFKYIEEPSENAPGRITIGDFYANIEKGLSFLSETLPPGELFPANTHEQVAHKYYYGGGGEITPVTDIDSAMFAINAIIAQGEGIPDRCWDPDKPFPLEQGTGIASGDHQLFMQPRELAHYYRFNELAQGRRYVCGDSHNSGPTGPEIPIDYAQVYNMKPNPNSGDYAFAPELAALDYEFNRIFTLLLDQLHNAFNGDPEVLVPAVGTMFKLKELAQELMRNPIPDSPEQYTAGPTWQYLKG